MKIIAIVIAAALALVVAYWLRSRPSWWYLRDRSPDHSAWQQTFTPDQMPVVISAIETIAEAFLLRQGDAFRLRPADKLLAIYRAAYPNSQTPDALEFETLSKELMHRYQVPEAILSEESDPTVQDVVRLCLRYSAA